MADAVYIKMEGAKEFAEVMDEITNDFNEKDSKKILKDGAKKSMSSVLSSAQSLVREDTGALKASLKIESRKPTAKDKRSVYVNPTDIVIGTVTTASGAQLARKKFFNLKTQRKQKGIPSDARATANEFGTAKMSAKPFLRPALESQSQTVVDSLATTFKTALEKYRSKYI